MDAAGDCNAGAWLRPLGLFFFYLGWTLVSGRVVQLREDFKGLFRLQTGSRALELVVTAVSRKEAGRRSRASSSRSSGGGMMGSVARRGGGSPSVWVARHDLADHGTRVADTIRSLRGRCSVREGFRLYPRAAAWPRWASYRLALKGAPVRMTKSASRAVAFPFPWLVPRRFAPRRQIFHQAGGSPLLCRVEFDAGRSSLWPNRVRRCAGGT